MIEQKEVNRRQFLKGAAIGTLGLVVLCGGGGLAAGLPPAIDYVEATGDSGSKKVLVTYASKAGSTGEVAGVISEVLKSKGLSVDTRLINHGGDLSAYQGVIVGGCVRMGKWLPDAVDFVKKNQSVLKNLPVSYFLTCATMREDTPENRAKVSAALDEASAIVTPLQTGLFGGKMDFNKLSFLDRTIAKMVGSVEGDFRDWNAIKNWAAEALPLV